MAPQAEQIQTPASPTAARLTLADLVAPSSPAREAAKILPPPGLEFLEPNAQHEAEEEVERPATRLTLADLISSSPSIEEKKIRSQAGGRQPASATRLTLADLISSSPKKEEEKIRPPPGLEVLDLDATHEAEACVCGVVYRFAAKFCDQCGRARASKQALAAKDEIASESDETSAGSSTEYCSSEADSSIDSETTQSIPSQSLVLSEMALDKTVLKANSPSFVPMLGASMSSTLPAVTKQQTPLRAKLRSKAAAFVPTEPNASYMHW
jgi:hypothetical protein